MIRQIILDTETTGLDPKQGHKIVEIGCVELINRKVTGNTFHQYINPQKMMNEEVISIHGITNEFVQDKPLFSSIVDDFIDFIKDSEIIAHNASFDINFINHELASMDYYIEKIDHCCNITDSLAIAKNKHRGQRNNLDALCKRYGIDHSSRTHHGALLDAQLLAEVYLLMTGGQTSLFFDVMNNTRSSNNHSINLELNKNRKKAKVIYATKEELLIHKEKMQEITKT